jgi:hypothetical protein
MHKNATKCNETVGKWCKNKHGASKIIDTLETYHHSLGLKAQSDAARGVSSQGWREGLYKILEEDKVVHSPYSSHSLQQKNNRFASPTNHGVCQAHTTCKFTKQKNLVTKYSCDFWVYELPSSSCCWRRWCRWSRRGNRERRRQCLHSYHRSL